MKIIILVLLMAAQAYAGWFNHDDYKDRWQQSEQQLVTERQSKGDWEIIAGVLAIGTVILFTVGTALGSKIRRDAKKEAHHD